MLAAIAELPQRISTFDVTNWTDEERAGAQSAFDTLRAAVEGKLGTIIIAKVAKVKKAGKMGIGV